MNGNNGSDGWLPGDKVPRKPFYACCRAWLDRVVTWRHRSRETAQEDMGALGGAKGPGEAWAGWMGGGMASGIGGGAGGVRVPSRRRHRCSLSPVIQVTHGELTIWYGGTGTSSCWPSLE